MAPEAQPSVLLSQVNRGCVGVPEGVLEGVELELPVRVAVRVASAEALGRAEAEGREEAEALPLPAGAREPA